MERIQKIQKLQALRHTSPHRSYILPLLFLLLCSCAPLGPSIPVDTELEALKSAETEISESQLLDVSIQIFDPGELPESKDEKRGLSEEIREAESQYMAVQLKNSLQQTGHWGAVRVIPEVSPGSEVMVHGSILKSNGEELQLEIVVWDAVGETWLKKSFQGAVDEKMYKDASKKRFEVFQNVYCRIANEIAAYRLKMTPKQVTMIRQVAEMRFAEELVPSAFDGYLKKEKGNDRINIDRLPSEDNEMMMRVQRVRERDYMLVDTLDAHYESLHHDMKELYMDWRKSRLAEMYMIREVEEKKRNEQARGIGFILAATALGALGSEYGGYNPGIGATVSAAAAGGVNIFINADQIAEEVEINKAALEELGTSFGAEIEPIVVEVEGETIELTGTAEAKYQQWQDLLGKLYQAETEVEMASPTALDSNSTQEF